MVAQGSLFEYPHGQGEAYIAFHYLPTEVIQHHSVIPCKSPSSEKSTQVHNAEWEVGTQWFYLSLVRVPNTLLPFYLKHICRLYSDFPSVSVTIFFLFCSHKVCSLFLLSICFMSLQLPFLLEYSSNDNQCAFYILTKPILPTIREIVLL